MWYSQKRSFLLFALFIGIMAGVIQGQNAKPIPDPDEPCSEPDPECTIKVRKGEDLHMAVDPGGFSKVNENLYKSEIKACCNGETLTPPQAATRFRISATATDSDEKMEFDKMDDDCNEIWKDWQPFGDSVQDSGWKGQDVDLSEPGTYTIFKVFAEKKNDDPDCPDHIQEGGEVAFEITIVAPPAKPDTTLTDFTSTPTTTPINKTEFDISDTGSDAHSYRLEYAGTSIRQLQYRKLYEPNMTATCGAGLGIDPPSLDPRPLLNVNSVDVSVALTEILSIGLSFDLDFSEEIGSVTGGPCMEACYKPKVLLYQKADQFKNNYTISSYYSPGQELVSVTPVNEDITAWHDEIHFSCWLYFTDPPSPASKYPVGGI